MIDLSIIIPTYNEAGRIRATLQELTRWLDATRRATEVIVVDDGSTDDTVAVVEAHAQQDTRFRAMTSGANYGKEHAVGLGIAASKGELVLFTDADLSIPITQIDLFCDALEEADIAVASRAKAGASVGRRPPLHRQLMGRVFNAWVQIVALPGLHDTQCGFKLFRGDIARDVFARRTVDGFAFDVEILYLARRNGLRVVEVPVHWDHHEQSRILPVRDSVDMFTAVWRIRRQHNKSPAS